MNHATATVNESETTDNATSEKSTKPALQANIALRQPGVSEVELTGINGSEFSFGVDENVPNSVQVTEKQNGILVTTQKELILDTTAIIKDEASLGERVVRLFFQDHDDHVHLCVAVSSDLEDERWSITRVEEEEGNLQSLKEGSEISGMIVEVGMPMGYGGFPSGGPSSLLGSLLRSASSLFRREEGSSEEPVEEMTEEQLAELVATMPMGLAAQVAVAGPEKVEMINHLVPGLVDAAKARLKKELDESDKTPETSDQNS